MSALRAARNQYIFYHPYVKADAHLHKQSEPGSQGAGSVAKASQGNIPASTRSRPRGRQTAIVPPPFVSTLFESVAFLRHMFDVVHLREHGPDGIDELLARGLVARCQHRLANSLPDRGLRLFLRSSVSTTRRGGWPPRYPDLAGLAAPVADALFPLLELSVGSELAGLEGVFEVLVCAGFWGLLVSFLSPLTEAVRMKPGCPDAR